MKKSFTLKAFAFGAAATVALAASATPHEFILKAQNEPVAVKSDIMQEAPVPVRMSVKQANAAFAKAPAQKAEPSYGEWTAPAEGTYTFKQALKTQADFNYQKCDDTANPGNMKVKITNWGAGVFTNTGIELEFTIKKTTYNFGDEAAETMAPTLPAGGVFTGFQAGGYPDGQKHDVYVFDRVSYFHALQAAGETWEDGDPITDEQCEQWYALYDYDNTTGLMIYYPVYCLVVDNKPTWYTFPSTETSGTSTVYLYETYQMRGNGFKNYSLDLDVESGYFSHEKDAATGTFNLKYNINDNNEAWFQIVSGRKTGNNLQTAQQALMEIAYNGTSADDVIKVTESTGEISLPVTNYRKGQYTLLCVARYPGQEDGYFGTAYDNSLRLVQEDLDYYAAGTATYTDAMLYDGLLIFGPETDDFQALQQLFKDELDIDLPDEYTVTVPMQASSKNDNEYRLVHPYAEYFNNYLSRVLDYDIMSDYLLFNTADATKSYILPSASGIYFEATNGSTLMITYGSTNKMEGGATGSADAWGTFSNGAVTFPELQIPEGATSIDQVFSALSHSQATFNPTSGVITYADWASPLFNPELCKIEGAGIQSGVENVAADAELDVNAPVEYFNLQGIRVATPEAGQLLIKRQGNKASKVVIR